jgi:hypothetical protein
LGALQKTAAILDGQSPGDYFHDKVVPLLTEEKLRGVTKAFGVKLETVHPQKSRVDKGLSLVVTGWDSSVGVIISPSSQYAEKDNWAVVGRLFNKSDIKIQKAFTGNPGKDAQAILDGVTKLLAKVFS